MPLGLMILIIYLIVINIWAFFLFGRDKRLARRERWRIPEKRLWLAAWLGGCFGATLGMRTFRHKTKHAAFKFGLPAICILYAAGAVWLIQRFF